MTAGLGRLAAARREETGRAFTLQRTQQIAAALGADALLVEFLGDAVGTDLVQLVERDQRQRLLLRGDVGLRDQCAQQLAVIEQDLEVGEAELLEHGRDCAAYFGVGDDRLRAGDVDVTLIELAEAAFWPGDRRARPAGSDSTCQKVGSSV